MVWNVGHGLWDKISLTSWEFTSQFNTFVFCLYSDSFIGIKFDYICLTFVVPLSGFGPYSCKRCRKFLLNWRVGVCLRGNSSSCKRRCLQKIHAKSYFTIIIHNHDKILKSHWLSAVLISALIVQQSHAWAIGQSRHHMHAFECFFLTAGKNSWNILCFNFKKA